MRDSLNRYAQLLYVLFQNINRLEEAFDKVAKVIETSPRKGLSSFF